MQSVTIFDIHIFGRDSNHHSNVSWCQSLLEITKNVQISEIYLQLQIL